jgi:hypothetical protein
MAQRGYPGPAGRYGTIDLVTENTAHGGNLPLALKFTDNVVRSISVD